MTDSFPLEDVTDFVRDMVRELKDADGCDGQGEYSSCAQHSELVRRLGTALERVVNDLTDAAEPWLQTDALVSLACAFEDEARFDPAWRTVL